MAPSPIRDIDSLVFSLHHNRGVYALLLGSGVSRAAGVLTGWEIIQDLIRKWARSTGEEIEGDPAGWYLETVGEQPSYSDLLQRLGRTQAERQAVLKPYFEPTEEERERGSKVPTRAHRAIARLVRQGVIKAILTTNFDQLLEQALRTEGIVPTVVSTPAAMDGMPPLAHLSCVVVKLHGDYLDTRLRNTEGELEKYNSRQNRLLRQAFDEYGLIVCGWSAEWDQALVSALEGCKSRRYSTFWTHLEGGLSKKAEELARLRDGRLITITGADEFFETVADRVDSLAEYDRPHPLSKEIAVAQLKKYLPEERHKIRLRDLVMEEMDRVYEATRLDHFPLDTPVDAEQFGDRLLRYEASTQILESLLAVGAYWGSADQAQLWVEVLERIGSPQSKAGIIKVAWDTLQAYPATRLLYAAGLAATAGKQYGTLWSLLSQPKRRRQGEPDELLLRFAGPDSIDSRELREFTQMGGPRVASAWLARTMRPALGLLVTSDQAWQELFDRFEFLLAMATSALLDRPVLGLFATEAWLGGSGIDSVIAAELTEQQAKWPPLQAGFLNRDLQAATAAVQRVNDACRRR